LPCIPTVGSISYLNHRGSGHDPHWPCPCDHAHKFEMHQTPNTATPPCKCFWRKFKNPICLGPNDPDMQPPIAPAAGGGLAP
jgi:hypothetical protein